MRPIHIKGIEILDNENIPEGEIHLLCPMQNGGKVRYMFNLLDHRMTQPGADKCFLLNLEEWLERLRGQIAIDGTTESVVMMDVILMAITDFKSGKDPRTLPDEADGK